MGIPCGCGAGYNEHRGPDVLDAGSPSVKVADERSLKRADYGGHVPRCSQIKLEGGRDNT
jgi:hypothetical protein